MEKPRFERRMPNQEEILDDKVRQIMYKRKITYQEASELVKKGQKALFEF